MSKINLRTTKEITVKTSEMARDTIENMEIFLLLVKRYIQRGTIA